MSQGAVASATAGTEAPTLEVLDAWYGFEGGRTNTAGPCGNSVASIVASDFLKNGSRLVVPGSLKMFFGDPVPGALKVLAVHIRDLTSGLKFHLRFRDNIGGTWTAAMGSTSCNSLNLYPKWRVKDATYGPASEEEGTRTGLEGCSIAAIVQSHFGGDQILRMSDDFNGYFGDPFPEQTPKTLRVWLEGEADEEHTLTLIEGRGSVYFPKIFSPEDLVAEDGTFDDSDTTADFQIVHAWYGVEGGRAQITVAGGFRKVAIAKIVKQEFVVQDGNGSSCLRVPGDMNRAFRKDPAHSVVKTLAVHVRVRTTNQDFHLRFPEHVGGTWTVADGATSPNSLNTNPAWRVTDACYGATFATGTREAHDGRTVASTVQALFGGDQVLRIQNKLNSYFKNTALCKKALFVYVENSAGETRALTFRSSGFGGGPGFRWSSGCCGEDNLNVIEEDRFEGEEASQ